MNWKIIIVIIVVISATVFWIFGRNTPIENEGNPAQKAAHDSFMGSPPKPSQPYNILDYTKTPAKQ